jgi:hypothetical protein
MKSIIDTNLKYNPKSENGKYLSQDQMNEFHNQNIEKQKHNSWKSISIKTKRELLSIYIFNSKHIDSNVQNKLLNLLLERSVNELKVKYSPKYQKILEVDFSKWIEL